MLLSLILLKGPSSVRRTSYLFQRKQRGQSSVGAGGARMVHAVSSVMVKQGL